jgi:hypothetical protein
MKGKAYANRKKKKDRPESDYYGTPKSCIYVLKEQTNILNDIKKVYEPACGKYRLSRALNEIGIETICNDIITTKVDFLKDNDRKDIIITNPPFSLFDEFVMQARKVSNKWIFIAKSNFFGAYKRNKNGIWKNLKYVYIFNRQIDYRSPYRKDGKFYCGNLITGWFIWDKNWNKPYWKQSILDVQDYVIYKENKVLK